MYKKTIGHVAIAMFGLSVAVAAPATPAAVQTNICYEAILFCKYQGRDHYPTPQECWEAESLVQCPQTANPTGPDVVGRIEPDGTSAQ